MLGRLPLVARAIIQDSGKAVIAPEIAPEVENILNRLLAILEKNTDAPTV